MKKFLFIVLSILMLALPITAYASESTDGIDVNGKIDWNNGVIQVVGMGFAPSNAINGSQAAVLARRGAMLDGYRNLLETIKGIRIDAESSMINLQVNDSIRSKVFGLVRGAHIVSEQAVTDGGYKVTMEVKLYGENSIAAAVFQNNGVAQSLPESTKPAAQYSTLPDYTGVVIDARGLGLERVMSPLVSDDKGRKIYGHQFLDADFIVKNGMVDYITPDAINEVNSGRSRAGSNPLIIKAIAVQDFNANVVISEDDANKILIANKQTGFLAQTKVVFEQ